MGRLTERYTNKGISGVCLKALDYKGNTADASLVLERLAEFEDFMEEQGFEDLEIVKKQCDLSVDFLAMDSENTQLKIANEKLYKENQALKDKWQKLKKWITEQSNPINNLVVSDDETKYIYMSDILDEIQELEKE